MAVELTLWGTPAAVQSHVPGSMTRIAKRIWAKIVGLSLRSGECFAAAARIAGFVGCATRTVQKWLGIFTRWGWIETVRQGPRAARRIPVRHDAAPAPCASSVRINRPRTTFPTKASTKTNGVRHGASARASFPSLTSDQMRDPIRMRDVLRDLATQGGRPSLADDPRTLLRWFGLIARSLRVAKNPAGCFRALWRKQCWDWISQGDEDDARDFIAWSSYGQQTRRPVNVDAVAEVYGAYDE